MSNKLSALEFLPMTSRTEGCYRMHKVRYCALALQTTEEEAEREFVCPEWLQTWKIEHGIIGMSTETSELLACLAGDMTAQPHRDTYHIIEEVGDVLWYVAILLKGLSTVGSGTLGHQHAARTMNRLIRQAIINGSTDFETRPFTLVELGLAAHAQANTLLDLLKKDHQYGILMSPTDIEETLMKLLMHLQRICFLLQYDLEVAMAANIAKLWSRYPKKFSQEDAAVRDLAHEMNTLKMTLA